MRYHKITPSRIIQEATALTEALGLRRFSRLQVAERLGVVGSAICYHYRTVEMMHAAVIRGAITNKNLRVIALAVAINDPLVSKIDPKLRSAALNSLK